MMIQTKRVYESASPRDGKRFLVERLWPRGMTKTSLKFDGWLKDVAPSAELRRWYAHDVAKWPQFKRKYTTELAKSTEALAPVVQAARRGAVTLLYSAHDVEHNSALILKIFLEKRMTTRRNKTEGSSRKAIASRRTVQSRR
jgi:uncharacterized protein YeaO (DUF488 family)